MTAFLRRTVTAIPEVSIALFRDLVFLAGLGAVGYGVSLIYLPAAIIFGGACLAGLAYLSAPAAAVTNEPIEHD